MTFKLDNPQIAGYPAIEAFLPTAAVALAAGIPATRYPPMPPGLIVQAEDPVWGPGEFIFAKANGTIPLRAMCSLIPVWNATNRNYDWNATAVPNTTLLGKMVGVCM